MSKKRGRDQKKLTEKRGLYKGSKKIQMEKRKSRFYHLIEYLELSIFQLQNKKLKDIRLNQGLQISWKNEKQKNLSKGAMRKRQIK